MLPDVDGRPDSGNDHVLCGSLPARRRVQPPDTTICNRLPISRRCAYLVAMSDVDVMPGADFPAPRSETAEEKAERIAREAVMIAEALASVAAGRVVSFEAVSAWIDSLDTDHELPVPQSGR